jgi:hypothetical protein
VLGGAAARSPHQRNDPLLRWLQLHFATPYPSRLPKVLPLIHPYLIGSMVSLTIATNIRSTM